MKRLALLLLLTPVISGSRCQELLRKPDAVQAQVRVDTLGVVYLDGHPLNTPDAKLEQLLKKVPEDWKARKASNTSLAGGLGTKIYDRRGLSVTAKCVTVRCSPPESLKKQPANPFSGVVRLPDAKPISCADGPHLRLALDAMDPSRSYTFGDSFEYKSIEVGTNRTPKGGLAEVWFCQI